MEMETAKTIEVTANNVHNILENVEDKIKEGLLEAYKSESTLRLSISLGIKPTSQIDRAIKGRISFPVLRVSKAFSDEVTEGQMELEFEEETEAPEVEVKEVECAGCRAVIDRDDAFFVSDIGKDLCPDCAAFWNSDESIDTMEPPKDDAEDNDMQEENDASEQTGTADENQSDANTSADLPKPLKDAFKKGIFGSKSTEEEAAPHADWPIPLDPDEIKRLQPVQVAEFVALVKEKFPMAHFHAKELLQVKAIRGADICRKALHHMNAWYQNSGPGKTETEVEAEHAYENTMGG